MFTLSLGVTENPRGPGLWKLNTSFLGEVEFTNRVKTVISQTWEEYKDDNNVDDALLWEMIKLKVREESISYGKETATSRRKEENNFYAKVAYLEKKVEEPIPSQVREENTFIQYLLRFANVSTLQSFYRGIARLDHLSVEVKLLFIPFLLEDMGSWLHFQSYLRH